MCYLPDTHTSIHSRQFKGQGCLGSCCFLETAASTRAHDTRNDCASHRHGNEGMNMLTYGSQNDSARRVFILPEQNDRSAILTLRTSSLWLVFCPELSHS